MASGHAVIYKRDPRSAALWLIVIWLLPALGPVLYVLLGVNRVQRRAAAPARRHGAPPRRRREPRAASRGRHFAPLARLVGEVVERPLLPGNALEPLVDGAQAYPAMLEAIRGARSFDRAGLLHLRRRRHRREFVAALGARRSSAAWRCAC